MSLHNDNALVVALDTSTDMLACAASWIDGQTGETKLVSGDHMCRRHANVELVNTVDGVLAQAGLDRSDVGCYVVGRGHNHEQNSVHYISSSKKNFLDIKNEGRRLRSTALIFISRPLSYGLAVCANPHQIITTLIMFS